MVKHLLLLLVLLGLPIPLLLAQEKVPSVEEYVIEEQKEVLVKTILKGLTNYNLREFWDLEERISPAYIDSSLSREVKDIEIITRFDSNLEQEFQVNRDDLTDTTITAIPSVTAVIFNNTAIAGMPEKIEFQRSYLLDGGELIKKGSRFLQINTPEIEEIDLAGLLLTLMSSGITFRDVIEANFADLGYDEWFFSFDMASLEPIQTSLMIIDFETTLSENYSVSDSLASYKRQFQEIKKEVGDKWN